MYLLLLLAVGFLGANAQAQMEVKNGAQLEFEKETHDYGTVAYGSDRFCTFEFKNTGNAPLIISKAIGSCGCTVPTWPKEPIAPGATGKIVVKYDTERPGVFNKTVTITSNATNDPGKKIFIKGKILPKPTSGTPVNKTGPATN